MTKITLTQLKRIIKEEVTRTTRSRRLSEVGARQSKYLLNLEDCSMHAEDMDMSVNEFVTHVMAIGSKYPSIEFDNPMDPSNPYNAEYDSLSAVGSKKDLTAFARILDQEFMGGAQSIAAADSFVNLIEPF